MSTGSHSPQLVLGKKEVPSCKSQDAISRKSQTAVAKPRRRRSCACRHQGRDDEDLILARHMPSPATGERRGLSRRIDGGSLAPAPAAPRSTAPSPETGVPDRRGPSAWFH